MTPLSPIDLAHLHAGYEFPRGRAAWDGYAPKAASGPHTSVMVALVPPPEIAARLVLPDGEPAEQLHVTLAFLGELANLPDVRPLRGLISQFAATSPPLDGTFNGIARFCGTEEGADACVVLLDAPALPAWRQTLVEILAATGYVPAMTHGYTPHATISLIAPADDLPLQRITPVPVTFGTLTLAIAGQWHTYPLAGGSVARQADRLHAAAGHPRKAVTVRKATDAPGELALLARARTEDCRGHVAEAFGALDTLVDWMAVEAALAAGDRAGVLAAIDLPARLTYLLVVLYAATEDAAAAGAAVGVARLAAGGVYNVSPPSERVTAWARSFTAGQISEIVDGSEQALKSALRVALGLAPAHGARLLRAVLGLSAPQGAAIAAPFRRAPRTVVQRDGSDDEDEDDEDLVTAAAAQGETDRDRRALVIALFLLSAAVTMGALLTWQDAETSGRIPGAKKEWQALGPNACSVCLGLDGEVVGVHELFSNGEPGPPEHGRCECSLAISWP